MNNNTYTDAHKRYYQKNKEKLKKNSNKPHNSLRDKLFSLLGERCVRCGFSDRRALQLDHINGGGTKEARSFKSNYYMHRFYLRNSNFALQRLQVLCANCNWIKRHENNEVRK